MNSHCALVVAIEFPVPAGGLPDRPNTYFDRALAQPLANQLAFELAKQLPSLEGLGLVWMAGCFDQAQILRPGFPVHSTLANLYSAGMRDSQAPQVMTLQALRGSAPQPELAVEEQLLGGPMVLLPLALVGDAKRVDQARAILEEKLLETGLADARTALMLNSALNADAEHARLMTLDDLAALCAIQLDHAGLGAVWQILEVALFRPSESVSTAVGNCTFSYADELLSVEVEGLASHDLADFATRSLLGRQSIALLQAHGLKPQPRYVATGKLEQTDAFWIDWLDANEDSVAAIHAYRSPQLGVVCYALLDAKGNLSGHAYPINSEAPPSLQRRFADSSPQWLRSDLATL